MPQADDRRSERTRVLLTAVVEHAGSRIRVRVSNLSAHGALVIGKGLPFNDTLVTFRCNGSEIESWVAWSRDGLAGLQFSDPIEPEKLVRRLVDHHGAIMKDNRTLDFRRPGFRGNQMTAEERKTLEEWSREQLKPLE